MSYVGTIRLNTYTYISHLEICLSLSFMLDVCKEVYSPSCHWQPLCDPEGPSLRMKSMPRTAVDKDIIESVTLFLPLEAALPLDFIPRGSNLFPLFKLV